MARRQPIGRAPEKIRPQQNQQAAGRPRSGPLFIKAGGGKIPRQQEKRRQRRTNQPLVGRKPHGRNVLHDNHQRRQQPSNLHPRQTRVNFFTGRRGDGHDSPILDDCFKKALFFIDFIDEKRPYQAFTGIVLWEIPENDFFLIFSFTALYFHMGNSISFCTHSERRGCINTRSRTGYSRILPKQLLPHHLALINGEMHLPYCRFSRMVLPLQFRIFHSSMPYVANASPSLPDGS